MAIIWDLACAFSTKEKYRAAHSFSDLTKSCYCRACALLFSFISKALFCCMKSLCSIDLIFEAAGLSCAVKALY